MNARGISDLRAAAGTVAAFLAAQDVYQSAPSLQRDVTGVLVNAWWIHQVEGNVVTVAVGTGTRQFLRAVDGSWITPGAGAYARLTQGGNRTPEAFICYRTYPQTRGWDYSGVSFDVTNAHGDIQHWRRRARRG